MAADCGLPPSFDDGPNLLRDFASTNDYIAVRSSGRSAHPRIKTEGNAMWARIVNGDALK
jgi:hypothetical protein